MGDDIVGCNEQSAENINQDPAEGADIVPPRNPGIPGRPKPDAQTEGEENEPPAPGTDPLHEGP